MSGNNGILMSIRKQAVRAIAASNKSATANDRIQAHANESDRKEVDRREGVPFSPERSPTGSQVGGGRE